MESSTYGLAPTTEIIGSYLSYECGVDRQLANDIKRDAVAVILSLANLDLSSFSVSVVENTATEVALVLPYYETLEQMRGHILSDSDISDIAGGEIAIGLTGLFASIGGAFGFGAYASTAAVVGGAVVSGLVVGSVALAYSTLVTTGALVTGNETIKSVKRDISGGK